MALAAVVVALGVWQGWRMYRGALETGTQQAGTTAQTQAESQTPDTAAPGPDEALADAEVTRLLAAAEADLAARRLTRAGGEQCVGEVSAGTESVTGRTRRRWRGWRG